LIAELPRVIYPQRMESLARPILRTESRQSALLAVLLFITLCLVPAGREARAAGEKAATVDLSPQNGRKALVLGKGFPFTDANGSMTHPQCAKINFLNLMGNPDNRPGQGWTCDMSYDVMKRVGLDPETASIDTLLDYIGQHHLGYRIIIVNHGPVVGFGTSALANGLMPFGLHWGNTAVRINDNGLGASIRVAGGTTANALSYGPGLEFFDAIRRGAPEGMIDDAAESWANQVVAARFARIWTRIPITTSGTRASICASRPVITPAGGASGTASAGRTKRPR
jgi:hypothetical protein